MGIQEIEEAIHQLPPVQRADLMARLKLGELRTGITEAVESMRNGEGQPWDASDIEAIKQEGRERLAVQPSDG